MVLDGLEPERRHLLGPDGHPARDRTRHASEQIPAGQREGHRCVTYF
jgi:hypothetical protein